MTVTDHTPTLRLWALTAAIAALLAVVLNSLVTISVFEAILVGVSIGALTLLVDL